MLGVSVGNEKSVWAGVNGQGRPEIKERVLLRSEVSNDMDLGVFGRSDQPGPVLCRKVSLLCGDLDSGPSGLSCV